MIIGMFKYDCDKNIVLIPFFLPRMNISLTTGCFFTSAMKSSNINSVCLLGLDIR